MRSDRFWIILIVAVFIVSCALTALINIIPNDGSVAEIYCDGELVQSVELTSVSAPYTIDLELGGQVNIIEVSHGLIRMLEANCPDQSCVRRGWISSGITPIVCLPHGIVIKITGGASDDADAVAG